VKRHHQGAQTFAETGRVDRPAPPPNRLIRAPHIAYLIWSAPIHTALFVADTSKWWYAMSGFAGLVLGALRMWEYFKEKQGARPTTF